MKLQRRTHEEPPVEIRVTLPAATVTELKAYCRYYEETYQEPIELPPLLAEIVQHFLRAERGFRRWERSRPA